MGFQETYKDMQDKNEVNKLVEKSEVIPMSEAEKELAAHDNQEMAKLNELHEQKEAEEKEYKMLKLAYEKEMDFSRKAIKKEELDNFAKKIGREVEPEAEYDIAA
jgi:hypothetical protein